VSRVERTRRGYEILRAMGAAERGQPADNDAFTNIAAAALLREAQVLAERLDHACPALWREVADGLVLPTDDAGMLLDHDGYDPQEEKAATPSAPAALLL